MSHPTKHPHAKWTEEDRLSALASYGIMDTPAETPYDDIVGIASQICGTPMALISLVDDHRQWFKAAVGLSVSETPRGIAFCAHAIQQAGLFVVGDASKDERFFANPLVTTDPHLRFYAGAPLHTPDGFPLGTLCVLDRQPRELTQEQRKALAGLSRQVMVQLELRRMLAEQETLTREMSHRVSNVLAITEALIRGSNRSSTSQEELAANILDRIGALGVAHGLVNKSFAVRDITPDHAANLRHTAHAVLAPYERMAHVAIEGPAVQLGPRAVNHLALALHEFATNAAKYGALSRPEGSLLVKWTAESGVLSLRWQETGGPVLTGAPSKTGFGSKLSDKTIRGSLGGTLNYDWRPAGLVLSVEIPLSRLLG